MGFTDFIKKQVEDFKESQKPENVKKRLEAKIEEEKLKAQLEPARSERQKAKNELYRMRYNKIKREF